MCDSFGAFLSHDWEPGAFEKISAALVAEANSEKRERFAGAHEAPSALAEIYYDTIRDPCPPA